MRHGSTETHGHPRLMVWDALKNSGFGQAPPIMVGGHWFIQQCADISLRFDRFEDASAGEGLIVTTPIRAQIRLPKGE